MSVPQVYEPLPNPNLNKTDRLFQFLKSSDAVFRIFQLAERVIHAVLAVFKSIKGSVVLHLKGLAGKFSIVWQMTALLRVPETATEAGRALEKFKKLDEGFNCNRETLETTNKVATALAMSGYSVSLLGGGMPFKNAADIPALVADIADAVIAAQDLQDAKQAREIALKNHPENKGLHGAYQTTAIYSAWRLAKDVCSVASNVFGLCLLASGGPVLPGLTFIVLGMASPLFYLIGLAHKENSEYALVNFYENRSIHGLASPA